MSIFDNEEFMECIRTRMPYTFTLNDPDMSKFSWDHFINMLDKHPAENYFYETPTRRHHVRWLERNDYGPSFMLSILDDMKKIFYKNSVTNIAFCGMRTEHTSYPTHKDPCDVMYLQVLGRAKFNVSLTETGGTDIISEVFHPGDMIWIPRGIYHRIEPMESRVSFSFGVEHEPDPSTYV